MIGTVIARFLRGLGAVAPVLVLWSAPVAAQPFSPPPAANAVPRSQACLRLESQLATIDRGGASFDPAKAEQIKRYEDAAAKQQSELDRLGQQSQRLGCRGGGFFSLFGGQSPQCGPLNNQIQHVRASLDRLLGDIQRLQGNSGEREGQRRSILIALGQNDCGPQYRQYANTGPGGFFENLFGGGGGGIFSPPDASPASTFRTLCVRTCDGYYFPISYSTVPNKFADDERLCQRLCPAAEAILYTHRNPGEDVARAVSASGRLYSELPTAFSYRKQFNAACSCRAPGQSWAEALRQVEDHTIERGDIVVTEERARQLSQPRFDAQGKPVNIDPNPVRGGAPQRATVNAVPLAPAGAAQAAPPPPPPPAEEKVEEDRSKRKVRAVGPTFYPVR
jgi:Protein of unknown function (DUF2865)